MEPVGKKLPELPQLGPVFLQEHPWRGRPSPTAIGVAGSPRSGAGSSLASAATFAEGRKLCRKADLPSPPLPFSAGAAASLSHPFPRLLAGGEPLCALCCSQVLGGHLGIAAPRPRRSLYVKLCTLQGTEKALRVAALLPAAAGLRPPNSSQQWRRIPGHTQAAAGPCRAPVPVPHRCRGLCGGRGSSPSSCPASRRCGEDARTNTASMGWAAKPGRCRAQAWGYPPTPPPK